jgi:hypothetical protein
MYQMGILQNPKQRKSKHPKIYLVIWQNKSLISLYIIPRQSAWNGYLLQLIQEYGHYGLI